MMKKLFMVSRRDRRGGTTISQSLAREHIMEVTGKTAKQRYIGYPQNAQQGKEFTADIIIITIRLGCTVTNFEINF